MKLQQRRFVFFQMNQHPFCSNIQHACVCKVLMTGVGFPSQLTIILDKNEVKKNNFLKEKNASFYFRSIFVLFLFSTHRNRTLITRTDTIF